MKLNLRPTVELAVVNGCEMRVWTGEDEAGTPVKAWIACVQAMTHDEEKLRAFEEELREKRQSGRVEGFDLRYLVD